MRSITTHHYLYSKLQITYDQNYDLLSLFFLPRNLFPRTYYIYISHVNKSTPLAGTWYIINGSKESPGLSCVHWATRFTQRTLLRFRSSDGFFHCSWHQKIRPAIFSVSSAIQTQSIRVLYTPTVVQLFQCIPSRLWIQKL
jgi:hypothetical protein